MGGGGVAEIFPVNNAITFPRFRDILGTFSGHLRITRRLWALTELQAHFPGLLTLSNHVTTSIHSRKKHLTTVWGGRAPWPPLATPLTAGSPLGAMPANCINKFLNVGCATSLKKDWDHGNMDSGEELEKQI